jgi:HK97 family phage prohead protease
MPWHIGKPASCPASEPFGVIKDADGSVAGCHPTKEAAAKQLAALYANEPGRAMADSKKPYGDVKYADPKNGKYPIDSAVHCKAAWSYINMPKNAAQYPMNGVTLASVKARIKAACKKFGITISEDNSAAADGEYRTVPFEMGNVDVNGDGLTFEGYAAVFNTPTRIAGWDDDFDEQIAPGAFDRTLAAGLPKLMFEHGRHPLIGTMPLGRLTRAEPDSHGVFVSGRLTDNWLIQPVRDAVREQAIDGMSFRFTVDDDDGETWMDRTGDVALRTLTSIDVPELGPVVFPAYEPTTASVRSLLDKLPVIGRPPAGARAASDREDGAGQRPSQPLTERSYEEMYPKFGFTSRDRKRLAERGLEGVRINV